MVRVGILGPGRIVRRVMKDLRLAQGIEITAVASRNAERAKAAAAEYRIPQYFTSYEELAGCENVDLVYIAVPHHKHKECAVLCMEHKKHVICEKPLAMNDTEAREMAACAKKNGVFLMEAMWTRFFPLSCKLREVLAAGTIGKVGMVTANFAGPSDFDPSSRLFDPVQGGGALLDLGVYAVSAASMVLGSDIKDMHSFCRKAQNGVDSAEGITLFYENGAMAQLFSSIDMFGDSRETIYGEKGRIDIPEFWHPTEMTVTTEDGAVTKYAFPKENEGFHHEFEHAAQCIEAGKTVSDIMPLDESIAIQKIMTDCRKQWGVLYPGEQ